MSRIDEFRQAKNSFVLYVAALSTIWFLAVCILFGVYVWCSFHNTSSITQDIDGDYNMQKVVK